MGFESEGKGDIPRGKICLEPPSAGRALVAQLRASLPRRETQGCPSLEEGKRSLQSNWAVGAGGRGGTPRPGCGGRPASPRVEVARWDPQREGPALVLALREAGRALSPEGAWLLSRPCAPIGGPGPRGT